MAACVYKVTRFVEWPAVEDSTKAFVVGYLQDDPFDGALAEVFADQSVRDRPVELRRIESESDIADVQLLVIPRERKDETCGLLSQARAHAVLTVGDFEGFGNHGGMVEMAVEDRRLKLRINQDACESAGLEVSSRLLALAEEARGSDCP
ncbi:MAG: YfiR family protein [bacterium]